MRTDLQKRLKIRFGSKIADVLLLLDTCGSALDLCTDDRMAVRVQKQGGKLHKGADRKCGLNDRRRYFLESADLFPVFALLILLCVRWAGPPLFSAIFDDDSCPGKLFRNGIPGESFIPRLSV